MAQRLDLHAYLVFLLGSENVYFQPPASVQMEYPAIVYERDRRVVQHADNAPYAQTKRYQVTFIGRDPDSEIPEKLAAMPLSSFDRHFATAGLNHDAFNIYF